MMQALEFVQQVGSLKVSELEVYNKDQKTNSVLKMKILLMLFNWYQSFFWKQTTVDFTRAHD